MAYLCLALATPWWLASCATSPTGRHQAMLVPQSQVDQMGDQAWQEVLAKTPESTDRAAKDFVDRVAGRVIACSPMADGKWDVRLLQSKQINAFALPASGGGGHIGVYTGILPVAQDEAGLATVLAHEVGHVIARHADERVSEELLTRGALGLAGVAIGSPELREPILGALGVGARLGILLPYSRAQEAEADEIGFLTMAKAGYDPKEAISFWDRMVKSMGGAEPPAFLSDHPATEDRIAHLRSLLPKAEQEYANATNRLGGGMRSPATGKGADH